MNQNELKHWLDAGSCLKRIY